MQIVRPDMLPMTAGFIILFLAMLGIIGAVLLLYGRKTYKNPKKKINSTILLVLGTLLIGFVVYNWIGYNVIYSKNEMQIIGKYECNNSNAILDVLENRTWKIKNSELCSSGKWEYIMSEDWNYWNIESDNMECRTQTGSAQMIHFEDTNLKFEKIIDHKY